MVFNNGRGNDLMAIVGTVKLLEVFPIKLSKLIINLL